MVSKPVGVWPAWCVGIGTQDDPEDATWQAVFEVRGCIALAMVEDKSLEMRQQYTEQGKEGECLPGQLKSREFNPFSRWTGWDDLLVALQLGSDVGNCWNSNR